MYLYIYILLYTQQPFESRKSVAFWHAKILEGPAHWPPPHHADGQSSGSVPAPGSKAATSRSQPLWFSKNQSNIYM